MDATILANINDATTTSTFLKSQRDLVEEAYRNDNSYLSAAQQASNSYMELKQRIPMVIEYYVSPEEIYTVEMYINPEKLSFKYQKVIGKQYTRAGIFFHHYGEECPVMTLTGNTGLAGMRGIEQLEKIFNYSGTLLRYQDVGINKIDNGESSAREIITLENFIDSFDNLMESASLGLNHIAETYNQLQDTLDFSIDKNSALLSKTELAKIILQDVSLLEKSATLIEYNSQVKTIVVQVNDELSGKICSFKEIYTTVRKYVLQTDFGDHANSVDSPTDIDQISFEIAYDIFDSLRDKAVDTTEEESSDSNLSEGNGTFNRYTVIYEDTRMYKEPTYESDIISSLTYQADVTLNMDTNNNGWYQHPSGGWIRIQDSEYEYRINSYDVYLYDIDKVEASGLPFSEIKNNRHAYSYNGNINEPNLFYRGIFTAEEKKILKNGEIWLRHRNGGWICEADEVSNRTVYLQLKYANVRYFICVHDGAYLYKEPNFASGRYSEAPLYVGGAFTAVATSNDQLWVKHINGGWCAIESNGIIYLQEDFTWGTNKTNNSATSLINNENPENVELKTNNPITTAIMETANDCTTALQKYIAEVREWNSNSVIKRFEIEEGIADIESELTDEWRPRVVFIYFEDRVYLGVFETFSYDRNAQSENIVYNMTFIIQRIISVTSINPDRFVEQTNNMTNGELEDYEITEQNIKEEMEKGNDLPLKLQILRARCIYYIENTIATRTGVPMTQERKDQIHNWAVKLREMSVYNGKQTITEDTPIYGNTAFDYNHLLKYIQLQYTRVSGSNEVMANISTDIAVGDAQTFLNLTTKINGEMITISELQDSDNLKLYNDVIEQELARVAGILNDYTSYKTPYDMRTREITYNYVNNLLFSLGARYMNNSDYKVLYTYWENKGEIEVPPIN